MARRLPAALLVLALLVVAPLAPAQAPRRYSGKVERVELMAGVVVVEELGERGRLVRHEVWVAAETAIVSAARLRPRDMRGPVAYAEVPVSLADLLPGDFVVVEAAEGGGRAVARRITIVEPPAASRPAP